jgi:hypothetical protein
VSVTTLLDEASSDCDIPQQLPKVFEVVEIVNPRDPVVMGR